jgi:hypothetical protein
MIPESPDRTALITISRIRAETPFEPPVDALQTGTKTTGTGASTGQEVNL